MDDQNPYVAPDHTLNDSVKPITGSLIGPISVSGRLTRVDVKKLHRQLPLYVVLWIAMGVYLAVQYAAAGTLSGLAIRVSVGGICLAFVTFVITQSEYNARRAQKKAEQNGIAPFEMTEYVISESGLTIRSQYSERTTRWPGFSGLHKTDDVVVLQLPGSQVTPILRRWFADPAEWQAAVQFMESAVSTSAKS